MQIITGRLTKDAEIRSTKDGRELVAFTLAVNDSYRPKNGERQDISSFYSCSYWISPNIVKALTKGSIVSVFGHIGINAYETKDKEFHASLTFHCNTIKIIAKAKSNTEYEMAGAQPEGGTKDDLPF